MLKDAFILWQVAQEQQGERDGRCYWFWNGDFFHDAIYHENAYLCTKYLCIHTEKYAGKLGAKMECGRMDMSHTQQTAY